MANTKHVTWVAYINFYCFYWSTCKPPILDNKIPCDNRLISLGQVAQKTAVTAGLAKLYKTRIMVPIPDLSSVQRKQKERLIKTTALLKTLKGRKAWDFNTWKVGSVGVPVPPILPGCYFHWMDDRLYSGWYTTTTFHLVINRWKLYVLSCLLVTKDSFIQYNVHSVWL